MSVKEHGSGYQVRVYAGRDAHSKERYLYGTRPTLKAAKSLERKLATQVEEGRHRHGRHTFGELLTKWYEAALPDLALNTQKGYEGWMRRVVTPELGTLELSKLTPDVLDELYGRLRTRYSARSVRQVHAIVRRACAVGVRWGWLTTNPASATTPPKVATAEMLALDPADARRFLAALATEDLELMIFLRLAAVAGPRRGELCGLRWGDFTPDCDAMSIARSLVPLKGGAVAEKAPKSGKSRRNALDPATAVIVAALRDRCQRRDDEIGGWDPNGYVFTVDVDRPWHPDHATGRYRRAAKRHGVKARLHDWRHYAATQMLDAGIPVKTVADRLGHANAAVTLAVYAHAIPATDQLAAGALAGTLD